MVWFKKNYKRYLKKIIWDDDILDWLELTYQTCDSSHEHHWI